MNPQATQKVPFVQAASLAKSQLLANLKVKEMNSADQRLDIESLDIDKLNAEAREETFVGLATLKIR